MKLSSASNSAATAAKTNLSLAEARAALRRQNGSSIIDFVMSLGWTKEDIPEVVRLVTCNAGDEDEEEQKKEEYKALVITSQKVDDEGELVSYFFTPSETFAQVLEDNGTTFNEDVLVDNFNELRLLQYKNCKKRKKDTNPENGVIYLPGEKKESKLSDFLAKFA